MDTTLTITHNAGFFSCCAMRLGLILDYFNKHKKLPEKVDSSKTFEYYKHNKEDDISSLFFEEKDIQIEYKEEMKSLQKLHELQFHDYKTLPFTLLQPFIQKYYSPSKLILEKVAYLEEKYKLDYSNLIGIRYRGTDKCVETNQPRYDEVVQKVQELRPENSKVLIQTDDNCFLFYCTTIIPGCISFEETYLTSDKLEMIQFFVASMYIFSKLKTIISTSGNSECFIALFRNSSEGIHQYLNHKEYIYGLKNDSYEPGKTNFWL